MKQKPSLGHYSSCPTRIRLLQLLHKHGELTGAAALGHDPTLPDGSIYTTLRRLEADKLVKSRQDTQQGLPGPPRRFYTITGRGRRYCHLVGELTKLLQTST